MITDFGDYRYTIRDIILIELNQSKYSKIWSNYKGFKMQKDGFKKIVKIRDTD